MGITGPLPEQFLLRLDPEARAALGPAGRTAAEAQARCADKLEREEQRLFAQDLLRRRLPKVWHKTNQASRATPGAPDFIVGVGGVTLWIEFKKPGTGRFSKEQLEFQGLLAEQKIKLHVVFSAAEAIALIQFHLI